MTTDLDIRKQEAEIEKSQRRSNVRINVTYLFSITYLLGALLFIGFFLRKGETQDVTNALAIFTGLSSAALGVVGFWFGGRKLDKNAELAYQTEMQKNASSLPPQDYRIIVERQDKTQGTGTLRFLVNQQELKKTNCWEDPDKLVAAKTYTDCSTTYMRRKGYKAVFLPDDQTDRKGIFIHQGSSKAHSDGCIVCDAGVIDAIFDIIPRDQKNISVDVKEPA